MEPEAREASIAVLYYTNWDLVQLPGYSPSRELIPYKYCWVQALGKHPDAITVAQVLMENMPFQKPAQLLHGLVVAPCESAIAGSVAAFDGMVGNCA